MSKGFTSIFLVFIVGIVAVSFFVILSQTKTEPATFISHIVSTPTPTPYQFPYKIPLITKNQSYRIILVGDSIVAAFGPNANSLRLELIKKYPDSEFVTYNYGYPAMNITTLRDRLTTTTKNADEEHQSILSQGFELIIIESFGYNPLSNLPLLEGLAKQTQILEESVQLILREKPNAVLVFMTPIALSKTDFAKGTYELSQETRNAWVTERIAYIENHKKFANEKGIPVIDVYQASLQPNGDVDKKYIGTDFIHPSDKGIDLMSKAIATFIYEHEIFPR
jgi:lysophospholipase L1-like esterase